MLCRLLLLFSLSSCGPVKNLSKTPSVMTHFSQLSSHATCASFTRYVMSNRLASNAEAFRAWAKIHQPNLDHFKDSQRTIEDQFAARSVNASDLFQHYCPWGDAMQDFLGEDGRIERWVHTPAARLHEHFTDDEIDQLAGLGSHVQAKCKIKYPDDTTKGKSLESLTMHWSGCDVHSCKGMLGVAQWMHAHKMHRLMFVGDSVVEHRYDAAVCDFYRTKQCKLKKMYRSPIPNVTDPHPQIMKYRMVSHAEFVCEDVSIDLSWHPFHTWDKYVENSDDSRSAGGDKKGFLKTLGSADVVVANQGLHGLHGIRHFISNLWQLAREKRTRVLWAESSSQHFQTPFGMFFAYAWPSCSPSQPDSCTPSVDWLCLPIGVRSKPFKAGEIITADNDESVGPPSSVDVATASASAERNSQVHRMFYELGVGNDIQIVPMLNLTLARWDLHMDSLINQSSFQPQISGRLVLGIDCTHFVYTPTFYAPQWHFLLRALERR